MKTTGRTIDWQAIHSKLEAIGKRLNAADARSSDDVERILRERALALAKPLPEAQRPGELLDLLVASIAQARYGIETGYVLEVSPLQGLTPVPCTPRFVLGIVNCRGRILPVLDVRTLLELPAPNRSEGGRVVAVQVAGMLFGIFADGVAGMVQVALQDMLPPSGTVTAEHRAIIRGVTKEMVTVLDFEALAREPRIMVNEEVD